MKVLVGCEESQAVCIAFRKRGHEAYSCDLQPCSGGHPEWHIQGDVFQAVKEVNPELFIGHPPCTFLTVSANKWLKDQPERKSGKLVGEERRKAKHEAEQFFLQMWNLPVNKICLENPIGSINSIIKPSQVIHPYYFGDPVSKATCLWLKGLPKLVHIKEVDLFSDKTHVKKELYTSSTGQVHDKWYYETSAIRDLSERTKARSKTFPGIAQSMATQWG
jgi:hypothetical protein